MEADTTAGKQIINLKCLIGQHHWKYIEADWLTKFIEDDYLLVELAIDLEESRRVCCRCGLVETYEPPGVCGGKTSKWLRSCQNTDKIGVKVG